MAVLDPWSREQAKAFRREPMTFTHHLAEGGLVDDAALEALFDRYPADHLDINHFTFDADMQASLRTGSRGEASGKAVMQAIRDGHVWINLRRADLHYPALGDRVRSAFEEMSGLAPGFKPVNVYGQLIVSSPATKVPYHADPPGVVLFHLRGRKRIWLYPANETYAPQDCMELICMKSAVEDLPYARSHDAAATVFDLEPGQAVSWPLHAPHRIENQGTLNVSFSADYQTWPSRRLNGAMVASGVLRRWGLPTPVLARTGVPAQAALWAASVAMKRMGLVRNKLASFDRSFDLADAQTA